MRVFRNIREYEMHETSDISSRDQLTILCDHNNSELVKKFKITKKRHWA
jgi:hypothetical protein